MNWNKIKNKPKAGRHVLLKLKDNVISKHKYQVDYTVDNADCCLVDFYEHNVEFWSYIK